MIRDIKIYTITTHYANNQGAMLQAYALCTYLNSLNGVDCEIIDYFREGGRRPWQLIPKPRDIRELLLAAYSLTQVKWLETRKQKLKVMQEFWDCWLHCTPHRYLTKKELLDNPPMGDIYICGSDQIWNRKIIKEDAYFFDFIANVDGVMRMSYAASVNQEIPETECEHIKPLLNKFDIISLREIANIPQIQALVSHIPVTRVCDPVFLLGSEEWDKMAKIPSINEEFILCYFLNTDSLAVELVNKLRQITGLKVVTLVLSSNIKYNSDINVHVYNPLDFVGYIKKAKYIVTNSFHCSAIASIYSKNFKVIPKHGSDARVNNLQDLYGYDIAATNEFVDTLTESSMRLDYSNTTKMDEFIVYSKQFLKTAIDEKRHSISERG